MSRNDSQPKTSRLCMKIQGCSIIVAKNMTLVQAIILQKTIEDYTKKTGTKLNGNLYVVS